jgi:hypothetical protein
MMHTQKVCINHFMDQLKVCIKCKESKALSEFSKDKSRKSGLRYECKDCAKEYIVKWRKINLEYGANWRKSNPERVKESNKFHQAKYKELNMARPESYYANRNGKFKYCSSCNLDKPLIKFFKNLTSVDGFQPRCNDCTYEYFKQRRKTDIQFKLRSDLRNSAHRLINLAGKIKEQSTEEIVDTEFTEAENILLDQMFKDGYTIEQLLNGELELDHKQPLAWFDLTNEDEYREAGHISNLHYITKEENRKKKDRYAHGPNNEIILKEEWIKKRQIPTISH